MFKRARLAAAAGVLAVAGIAGAATLAQAQPSAGPSAQATPTPAATRPAGQRGGMTSGRMEEHLNRLAGNLGVTPDKLRDALRQTAIQEIDAAVARGDIPADRAQQIKDRIQNGQGAPLGPRFGGPGARNGGFKGGIDQDQDGLAAFLGITAEQLRTELKGKSLAQVAEAHGKTRAQTVQYLTDQANKRLDDAVKNGRMTQQMADRIRQGQGQRIERLVDRVRQEAGRRRGP